MAQRATATMHHCLKNTELTVIKPALHVAGSHAQAQLQVNGRGKTAKPLCGATSLQPIDKKPASEHTEATGLADAPFMSARLAHRHQKTYEKGAASIRKVSIPQRRAVRPHPAAEKKASIKAHQNCTCSVAS